MSYRFKMAWVYTEMIATEMIEFETVWNWANN
jgi:hypothetical protein